MPGTLVALPLQQVGSEDKPIVDAVPHSGSPRQTSGSRPRTVLLGFPTRKAARMSWRSSLTEGFDVSLSGKKEKSQNTTLTPSQESNPMQIRRFRDDFCTWNFPGVEATRVHTTVREEGRPRVQQRAVPLDIILFHIYVNDLICLCVDFVSVSVCFLFFVSCLSSLSFLRLQIIDLTS